MSIVPLPLPPDAEARALLRHILEQGDVIGQDAAGRTVITLAIDQWTLERLTTFDAGSEDLEDADDEPEPDDELDGPAVSGLDAWRPARVQRAR